MKTFTRRIAPLTLAVGLAFGGAACSGDDAEDTDTSDTAESEMEEEMSEAESEMEEEMSEEDAEE